MATSAALRAQAKQAYPSNVLWEALFGNGVTTFTQTYATANATLAAPPTLTAVAATGGQDPTEAEYNALLVDVTAILAFATDLAQYTNSLVDALQAKGLVA